MTWEYFIWPDSNTQRKNLSHALHTDFYFLCSSVPLQNSEREEGLPLCSATPTLIRACLLLQWAGL